MKAGNTTAALAALFITALATEGSSSFPSKRQLGLPAATWGPYVSLGQTSSEYTSLKTIFVAGNPPSNQKGDIFLWPGLFDQANRYGGDLVQTVAELHPAADLARTCGAKAGQWYAL